MGNAQAKKGHVPGAVQITITKTGQLGMHIEGQSTHHVQEVVQGSAAQKAGVLPGMELVRVGETEVRGMPHAQCVSVLQKSDRRRGFQQNHRMMYSPRCRRRPWRCGRVDSGSCSYSTTSGP